MALQVCLKSILFFTFFEHTGAIDDDYEGLTDEIIMFEAGDVTQTYRIQMKDESICEKAPNECFFALKGDIVVTVSRATFTIDDSSESECGRLHDQLHNA